ncbi:hypothetical protein NPIL_20701, partial [Nephila pilipes]
MGKSSCSIDACSRSVTFNNKVESKVRNFGKRKAESLENLREELIKHFGDKYDIAALDDRIKKFLAKEFQTEKLT